MNKNTIENKEKFFAQYWGQEIFEWKYPEHVIREGIIESRPNLEKYGHALILNLKPLTSLKYEDAYRVSEMIGTDINELKKAIKSGMVSMDLFPTRVGDYLRSKGYAMPWNQITVEEQVEFGWVELKPENNK